MSERVYTKRVIASGSTVVAAGVNTVAVTTTRLPGEVIEWAAWVREDAAYEWCFDGFADAGQIRIRFNRTANPNEFQLSIRNTTVDQHTIDWMVFGMLV